MADVVHGVCRGLPTDKFWKRCARRTILFLPGRLCEKCVLKAQKQVLAALEAYEEGEDSVP